MWTSVEDVEVRWAGSDAPTNAVLVQAVIDDIELVIASDFPDIEDRLEDEDDLLARIRFVVARVALRVLRNPDGVREEAVGDARVAYVVNPDSIWLSSRERSFLATDSRGTQKAFTINPTPIVDEASDLVGAWVNGPLGSEPFA
jgi:hypothetical protein